MKPAAGNVRSAAAWVVDRVLATRGPAEQKLSRVEPRFDDRDRRLLRELTFGSLRWLRRLDRVIETAGARRLSEIDPELLAPLRIAAYQLLFLDRVPPHAAVSEAVDEARRRSRRRGATGFVNALLRRVARHPHAAAWPITESDPIRRLGLETSHPDFLVARWMDRFGEVETRRLLAVNNRSKPLHLLSFRQRGGPRELARRLRLEGIATQPSTLSAMGLIVREGDPLATGAFREGLFYLQDEASQAAAAVPPPRAGERVLDLAAAPGGKAFSLLAHEPSLDILAADIDLSRVAVLRENRARLRARLSTVVADATLAPVGPAFDRVVLDLPCTGTGTLRRHPELKWRVSAQEIERLSRQGWAMVRSAGRLVRAGGLLVVITCSLEPEEGVAVASRLLSEDPRFEPLPLEAELPPSEAARVVGPGSWLVLPGGEHDGFEVQVLRKRR